MSDIVEKLKQIQSLISECISSQEGGEYEEESEEGSESIGGGDEAGDKIKMAASMLKKRMG